MGDRTITGSTPPGPAPPRVAVPVPALVSLVGISGSGKTSFARRHFLDTEVLSSDRMREMISDDAGDQAVSPQAFSLLFAIARLRLQAGRICVVDATSVTREARGAIVELARECRVPAISIVFDVPTEVAILRDAARPSRRVGREVITEQASALAESRSGLLHEGFVRVHVLSQADIAATLVIRE